MKKLAVDAAFVIGGVIVFLVTSTVFNLDSTSFIVGLCFGLLLNAADEYINSKLP